VATGAEFRQDFWQDAGGEGEEQQGTGEEAGHFFGGVHAHDDGETGEAVFQDGDGGDAEERAVDGASAAEDARATEDDGGDGEEFVIQKGRFSARSPPPLGEKYPSSPFPESIPH
jgi:hypothetical protein